MSDGVFAARRGLPAVAIVTEKFVEQGDLIARGLGMSGLPRAVVKEIAGTGEENLARTARDLAPRLLAMMSPAGR